MSDTSPTPDLVGLTLADARDELPEQGVKMVITEVPKRDRTETKEDPPVSLDAYRILRQSVDEGGTITLTVAAEAVPSSKGR